MKTFSLFPSRLPGCALACAVLLTACGGGDTAPSPTASLSGVAAVGAPIVGGSVAVKCAGGSALNATTSATGAWQVSFSGQTLPCAVQVSGGSAGGSANTTPYHSVALSLGTVNITPLTDLVVAQLTGAAPQTWFGAPVFSGVSAGTVNAAIGSVATGLGLNGSLGALNPLTASFAAQPGDTLDDILEAIQTALGTLERSHLDLLAAAQAGNYTGFAGFGPAFTTAYGSLGGTPTTCATGATPATYAGTAGLYTTGQTVCFTASSTALSFSGKTLNNPVQNMVVSAPFSAYTFSDGADSYEVVFNGGVLYEINFLGGGSFLGQFTPAVANAGGSLTVAISISGVPATSVTIAGVPAPQDQTDFCGDIQNDPNLTALTSSGGSLTIDSCSFTGNAGQITATLTTTVPVALSLPYAVTYTYNP